MGVEGCITGGSSEALVIAKRYVFFGSRILVSFRQTKIYDVNVMLPPANSDQVVVGLNVSVEKTSRMEVLNSLDHLVSKHQHGFKRKLSMAVVEEIFEARAQ